MTGADNSSKLCLTMDDASQGFTLKRSATDAATTGQPLRLGAP